MGNFITKRICPDPTVGVSYKPVNEKVASTLYALQGIFNASIKSTCNNQYDTLLAALGTFEIDPSAPVTKSSDFIKQLTDFVTISINSNENLTSTEQKDYIKSSTEFIKVLTDNISKDGIVDALELKKLMVDTLKSICKKSTSSFASISDNNGNNSSNSLLIVFILFILLLVILIKKKKH